MNTKVGIKYELRNDICLVQREAQALASSIGASGLETVSAETVAELCHIVARLADKVDDALEAIDTMVWE